MEPAPVDSISSRTSGGFCHGRLSITITSPALSAGSSARSTYVTNNSRFIACGKVAEAVMVFQYPAGAWPTRAVATLAAAVGARHARRRDGLVEEEQARDVTRASLGERRGPGLTLRLHVRAHLL